MSPLLSKLSNSRAPAALAALLLAACAQHAPIVTAPEPASAAARQPAAQPMSSANSLSGYKIEAAQRLYQANSAGVFTGQPPPLLRSIVVVNVVVDESGKLVSSRIFRDNGDVEARGMALASLQRTALPRPTRAVLHGGQVEYLESWLFRRDGKFQVRTLAEIQAGE